MNIDHTHLLQNYKQTPSIDTENLSKDDATLKKQTDAFESIMIKLLLDNSMKTEDYLFPKGTGHEIYESMYRDALSDEVAGGFGFSEMLFNYLKENR